MMTIFSPLDNDLYKFTMQQAALHQHIGIGVDYAYKCRTPDIDFTPYVIDIENSIYNLAELRFTTGDLSYLSNIRFFKKDYLDFLKIFRFDPEEYVSVRLTDDNDLSIRIKGSWVHTILFEVPILSIISEIYMKHYEGMTPEFDRWDRLKENMELVKANPGFMLSDMGTRRRESFNWQDKVLEYAAQEIPNNLIGTSNVYFAKKHGLIARGTMAHEWLQAHQALYRIQDSQKMALENWAKEYRGELGIALTDVIGIVAFLKDFDLYLAKLFDGGRHDSGNPYDWGNKMLNHYKQLKVSTGDKNLTFSDGLTFKKAIDIYQNFSYFDINQTFGIGTKFTNDVGFPSLSMVLKMVKCNGQDVAKISDSSGKSMCENPEYEHYVKSVFGVNG